MGDENTVEWDATPLEAAPLGATTRDAGGRFVAGVSRNPAGRPKGSLNRRTRILMELLEESGEEIVRGLIASAKEGKPWAVKLCVDRLLPRAESRVEIDLPAVAEAAYVAGAGAAVIEMAAEGTVTLDEARGVMDLIELQRKAIETTNLEPRLMALEREHKRELQERKRRRGRPSNHSYSDDGDSDGGSGDDDGSGAEEGGT